MGRVIEVMFPGDEKVIINLDELLEIHEENLISEYAKQASFYAYYGTLYNRADRSVMELDAKKESLYAEIELDYREEYKDEKTTEGKIKSLVLTDESYAKQLTKYNYAIYRKGIMRTLMDALKMRADMLVSMGAHLRAEYEQTGMNMKRDKFLEDFEASLDKIKKKQV
jgi:hypothetical protein